MYIVREYWPNGDELGDDEFTQLQDATNYIASEMGSNGPISLYSDNTFRLFEVTEREIPLDIRPATGYIVTVS